MLHTHRYESLTHIIIHNGNSSNTIGEEVGILEVLLCEIHFKSLCSLCHIIIADHYCYIKISGGVSFTIQKPYSTVGMRSVICKKLQWAYIITAGYA